MRFLVFLITLGASFPAAAQERIFYPAEAQSQGIGGQVVLECLVGEDGRLACDVVEETPADMAFGAAALRMSQDWRVAPRTRDGVATAGGRVRRTLVFEPGPPPRVSHDPSAEAGIRWLERPSAQDFARLYPRRALDRGIEGRVTISCVVNDTHRLNCEVEAEDPPEMGFGAATPANRREVSRRPTDRQRRDNSRPTDTPHDQVGHALAIETGRHEPSPILRRHALKALADTSR